MYRARTKQLVTAEPLWCKRQSFGTTAVNVIHLAMSTVDGHTIMFGEDSPVDQKIVDNQGSHEV